MKELENNAYFWQKLDTLMFSSDCIVDHPKGSTHYKYSNLIYPVDYGSLKDITNSDQETIGIFKGSIDTFMVDAIVVSADILKKDCKVKLLIGCTEEETLSILKFLNQTDYQKAILIQRGSEVPFWSSND